MVLSSCFFFFKQKTAYEMLISDWSSDVCSSYLRSWARAALRVAMLPAAATRTQYLRHFDASIVHLLSPDPRRFQIFGLPMTRLQGQAATTIVGGQYDGFHSRNHYGRRYRLASEHRNAHRRSARTLPQN